MAAVSAVRRGAVAYVRRTRRAQKVGDGKLYHFLRNSDLLLHIVPLFLPNYHVVLVLVADNAIVQKPVLCFFKILIIGQYRILIK